MNKKSYFIGAVLVCASSLFPAEQAGAACQTDIHEVLLKLFQERTVAKQAAAAFRNGRSITHVADAEGEASVATPAADIVSSSRTN
jgi:hypothetical protein